MAWVEVTGTTICKCKPKTERPGVDHQTVAMYEHQLESQTEYLAFSNVFLTVRNLCNTDNLFFFWQSLRGLSNGVSTTMR